MTGGAKTQVLRRPVVNRFAVTVTGNTGYRRIMIARVIAGCMGEIDRRPSACGVAHITFLRGLKMRSRFSNRGSSVVTRTTAIGYTLVIKCGTEERCRGMAVGAI